MLILHTGWCMKTSTDFWGLVKDKCYWWGPTSSWASKNWWFSTVVLEKTLESPLDCKEIQPVNLQEISLEYLLEGLILKLKFQYFGHLMQRNNSLEKTLMLGKISCKYQSWIFIGRTDAEAEAPILWPPDVIELTHWKRPWCWEKLKVGGEEDGRVWDGWMASPTRWTWVWAVSRS